MEFLPHVLNTTFLLAFAILALFSLKSKTGLFSKFSFNSTFSIVLFIGPAISLVLNIGGFFLTDNQYFMHWALINVASVLTFFILSFLQKYSFVNDLPIEQDLIALFERSTEVTAHEYLKMVFKGNKHTIVMDLKQFVSEDKIKMFVECLTELDYPFNVMICYEKTILHHYYSPSKKGNSLQSETN